MASYYNAEHERRYRATERGREANRRNQARWKMKNRQKAAAHNMLNGAVASGALVRPDVCTRCGAEAYIQAHHADYSKPLDVEWWCVVCHEGYHHGRWS